ncbi:hypothetical protein [Cellulomonas wangsupingiae]|nr:hypothetical protein [Cellulomonas wangsupingiae]
MTLDQWLPAIFEGSFGAILALVGVYVAFRLRARSLTRFPGHLI